MFETFIKMYKELFTISFYFVLFKCNVEISLEVPRTAIRSACNIWRGAFPVCTKGFGSRTYRRG